MKTSEVILEQLGGQKFIVMTGAKNFMGDYNMLRFQVPRAKKGINIVSIRLDGNDTYTIDFLKRKGMTLNTVGSFESVYAENLRELFERETGLDTHL